MNNLRKIELLQDIKIDLSTNVHEFICNAFNIIISRYLNDEGSINIKLEMTTHIPELYDVIMEEGFKWAKVKRSIYPAYNDSNYKIGWPIPYVEISEAECRLNRIALIDRVIEQIINNTKEHNNV